MFINIQIRFFQKQNFVRKNFLFYSFDYLYIRNYFLSGYTISETLHTCMYIYIFFNQNIKMHLSTLNSDLKYIHFSTFYISNVASCRLSREKLEE